MKYHARVRFGPCVLIEHERCTAGDKDADGLKVRVVAESMMCLRSRRGPCTLQCCGNTLLVLGNGQIQDKCVAILLQRNAKVSVIGHLVEVGLMKDERHIRYTIQ